MTTRVRPRGAISPVDLLRVGEGGGHGDFDGDLVGGVLPPGGLGAHDVDLVPRGAVRVSDGWHVHERLLEDTVAMSAMPVPPTLSGTLRISVLSERSFDRFWRWNRDFNCSLFA